MALKHVKFVKYQTNIKFCYSYLQWYFFWFQLVIQLWSGFHLVFVFLIEHNVYFERNQRTTALPNSRKCIQEWANEK